MSIPKEKIEKIFTAIRQGEAEEAYHLLADIATVDNPEAYRAAEKALNADESDQNLVAMGRREMTVRSELRKELQEEEERIKFIRNMLFLALRSNSEKLKEPKKRAEMIEYLLQLPVLQDVAVRRDPKAYEEDFLDLVRRKEPQTYKTIFSSLNNGPLRYAVRNSLVGPVKQLVGLLPVRQALVSGQYQYSILIEALLELKNYASDKLEEASCVHLLLKAYVNAGLSIEHIFNELPQVRLPVMDGLGGHSEIALSEDERDNIQEWISKLYATTHEVYIDEGIRKLRLSPPVARTTVPSGGAPDVSLATTEEGGREEEREQAPTSSPDPARSTGSSAASSRSPSTEAAEGSSQLALTDAEARATTQSHPLAQPFLPSHPLKRKRDKAPERGSLMSPRQLSAAEGAGALESSNENESPEGQKKAKKLG